MLATISATNEPIPSNNICSSPSHDVGVSTLQMNPGWENNLKFHSTMFLAS